MDLGYFDFVFIAATQGMARLESSPVDGCCCFWLILLPEHRCSQILKLDWTSAMPGSRFVNQHRLAATGIKSKLVHCIMFTIVKWYSSRLRATSSVRNTGRLGPIPFLDRRGLLRCDSSIQAWTQGLETCGYTRDIWPRNSSRARGTWCGTSSCRMGTASVYLRLCNWRNRWSTWLFHGLQTSHGRWPRAFWWSFKGLHLAVAYCRYRTRAKSSQLSSAAGLALGCWSASFRKVHLPSLGHDWPSAGAKGLTSWQKRTFWLTNSRRTKDRCSRRWGRRREWTKR